MELVFSIFFELYVSVLLTFLRDLMVDSTKMVHETYWCSSSIAFQERRTDWILKIFTFNDKNP